MILTLWMLKLGLRDVIETIPVHTTYRIACTDDTHGLTVTDHTASTKGACPQVTQDRGPKRPPAPVFMRPAKVVAD